MNKLEYAAHVTHPVQHAPATGTLAMGIAGCVIAVTIVVVSAPGALTVEVAIAALTAGGTYGGLSETAGSIIDSFMAKSVAGHLVHGCESVLLGPDLRQAARANPLDTVADCDGSGKGYEGSKIVMIGKDLAPMSRRGDRLACNGTFADGIHSIYVGGPPSMEGSTVSEATRPAVKFFDNVLSAMGLAKAALKGDTFGLALKSLTTALKAEGGSAKDAGSVVGLLGTKQPKNLIDGITTAQSLYKGASGAANLAKLAQ